MSIKQAIKWPLLVVALWLTLSTSVWAETPVGTVSGIVKDDNNLPVVGAAVWVFGFSQEAVLKTFTDKNGRFVAADLLPGSYTIQASALGFKPTVVMAASIISDQTNILNFKLQRVADTLTPNQKAASYKHVLRRNRTIFQLEENDELAIQEEPQNSVTRETHGIVNFVASQAFSTQAGRASSGSVDFAVAQMFSDDIELVVAGQTGLGSGAQQRLDIQTSLLVSDDHKLNFTFDYSHLPTFDPNTSPGLNQYSCQVEDRWHIAGPLVLVYGLDFTHFDGAAQSTRISPHVGFDLQVTPHNQLFGAIYSPNGADIESSANFETTNVKFSGPVELIGLLPQPVVTDSKRWELGYRHSFKNQSRLETTFFLDKTNLHTLSLIPVNNNDVSPNELNINQHNTTRGVRVVYSQPINNNISASIGYSFSEGQTIDLATENQIQVVSNYAHILSGKIDTDLPSTGTRISAVVRFVSPQSMAALDPFTSQVKTLTPNFNIYITQALPMFSFVPGQWKATVDAQNLLDTSAATQRNHLVISPDWRIIRGGVSVRF